MVLVLCSLARAQDIAPVNGPQDRDVPVHAFLHATVHVDPTTALADATVIVTGDRITEVGRRVKVPAYAVRYDLTGAHIWPGVVEPFCDLGMKSSMQRSGKEKGAHHWNDAVHATTMAAALYAEDSVRARAFRAQGVGLVVTHLRDGIVQGSGAAVLLADRSPALDVLLPRASANFSLDKGTSKDPYPSSRMGAIALLRQTVLDARWYARQGSEQLRDIDLAALNDLLDLPLVFEAKDRNDVLRIASLCEELGLRPIVKGCGDAYARASEIAATGVPLLLPLDLPAPLDVTDPFEAMEVPLSDLKHWELAPHNAHILRDAGCTFAFTTSGSERPDALWPALRRVVLAGLDTATAMAALTTVPAELFGLDDQVGAIRPGMLADLIISTRHLLDHQDTILETWVAGRRFVQVDRNRPDVHGTFDLNLDARIYRLEVTGMGPTPRATVRNLTGDTARVKASVQLEGQRVGLAFEGRKLGIAGPVRLNGILHRDGAIWDGHGQMPDGRWIAWSALRQVGEAPERVRMGRDERTLDSLYALPPGDIWYPDMAFGSPRPQDTLTAIFRHATVWSNGPDGILRNMDVCVAGGRIKAVGRDLRIATLFPGRHPPLVEEIDATGKHLTCGIIDEHAHIAISGGVNESGEANSAEVRVGDVIDPDAIAIYRSLAGGVTTVQQLHGSANPIGGQSSLIKLRWGRDADGLRIADAPKFIKFALGENVKQSWSTRATRYPRTRMGVEQLMMDAFQQAREVQRSQDAYAALRPKERALTPAPRRDLRLEALAEVLRGERHITCHSYVQSEILMLLRLADSLGFHVNTFTHVLEGYKVAPELRAHGASASTFSDWWAYKFEVYEAIPYNAALMQEAGVNTAINSDDAEMERRLNQEAAKTMKYGGTTREKAWEMVTLGPARMLHLDQRMGSVEVGKDADLVLWTDDPLTIDAHVVMTLVDGVPYFDAERDKELRSAIVAERQRIIGRMLAEQRAGARVRKARVQREGQWHCESLGQRP